MLIHLKKYFLQVASRSSSAPSVETCAIPVGAAGIARSTNTTGISANTVATRNASRWACGVKVCVSICPTQECEEGDLTIELYTLLCFYF